MENLQVAEGISIDNNAGFGYSPGDIIVLNSNTAPTGFLACNGATITQGEYPSLFAVLGTYYDTAGLVCKLPNLNAQTNWTFPCSTVGNEAAYVVTSTAHSHTSTVNTITAVSYTSPAHNHQFGSNSNNSNSNHSHNGISMGVGVNVSSSLANRSNGTGQGVNLAIYGHTHVWGAQANTNALDHLHSHYSFFEASSPAFSHTHSANLSTTTTSGNYILGNVISMRYYIKW